jgi:hypothetical protein
MALLMNRMYYGQGNNESLLFGKDALKLMYFTFWSSRGENKSILNTEKSVLSWIRTF